MKYDKNPLIDSTNRRKIGKELKFRPDIDGLRAIAVISVIVFHFWPTLLAGGFLGVDIFFVISGYLITSIITSNMVRNNFTILDFYNKRVRRLMPALLFLLIFTTISAAAILLPSDLVGYGKSLIASLFFVANIYFWRDTNYFSRGAEEKPLLHLWSLGIEEQFYLLFPLLIYFLIRYARRWTFPTIVLVTIASFGLNVAALAFGGESPAFFLLPTRAWELGAGALIALRGTWPFAPRLSQLLSPMGAVLIALALFRPTIAPLLFPVATFAVCGAVLIIIAGMQGRSAVTKALETRAMVEIGAISYSLYLWHWPPLVLVKYYLVRPLTPFEAILLVSAVCAAAVLSWRYVEIPTRRHSFPTHLIWRGSIGAGLLLTAVGAGLIVTQGLPGRLNPQAASINAAFGTNYRCAISDYFALGSSRACALNLPTRAAQDADVILLGNSHAQMYAPLWRDILEAHSLTALLLPANGCLPTVSANINRDCHGVAASNLSEVLRLKRAKTVIVGLTWNHSSDELVGADGRVLDNRGNLALVSALDDLISKLHQSGKRVILIGPIAEPGYDIASVLSRRLAFRHAINEPTYMPKEVFNKKFQTALNHFDGRTDVVFVRPDKVLCLGSKCEFVRENRSLFADSTHIAIEALPIFKSEFDSGIVRSELRN